MSIKKISLYFKEGSSDKEYHAKLEGVEGGFVVNFQYGRRGSTLTTGTKTKTPVLFEKAEKAYNSLVKEKLAKGVRYDQDLSDCSYSQLKFKASNEDEDEEVDD